MKEELKVGLEQLTNHNNSQPTRKEIIKTVDSFYTNVIKKKTPPVLVYSNILDTKLVSHYLNLCFSSGNKDAEQNLQLFSTALETKPIEEIQKEVLLEADKFKIGIKLVDRFIIFGNIRAIFYNHLKFIRKIFNIKNDLLDSYIEVGTLGAIIPDIHFCVVSLRATVHIDSEHRLHKDGGSAIEFSGRNKKYFLRGVEVPKELAVTPHNELDLEMLTEITNADVRAEFINKVGIERCYKIGKLLDSYKNYDKKQPNYTKILESKYELLDLQQLYPNLKSAPYLSMVNLTTGTLHLEGVPPSCTTIIDALAYRLNISVSKYNETKTKKIK